MYNIITYIDAYYIWLYFFWWEEHDFLLGIKPESEHVLSCLGILYIYQQRSSHVSHMIVKNPFNHQVGQVLRNGLVALEIGNGQSYSIDHLVLRTRLVVFYYYQRGINLDVTNVSRRYISKYLSSYFYSVVYMLSLVLVFFHCFLRVYLSIYVMVIEGWNSWRHIPPFNDMFVSKHVTFVL